MHEKQIDQEVFIYRPRLLSLYLQLFKTPLSAALTFSDL